MLEMAELWPWLILAALGAYHGVNPAMGWLFAVALGLQEGRRGAVYQAFVPIALGHTVSVAVVVGAVLLVRAVIPLDALKYIGAAILVGFGVYKLVRSYTPALGGDAGRIPRPHRLVIPYGVGARRGSDADTHTLQPAWIPTLHRRGY